MREVRRNAGISHKKPAFKRNFSVIPRNIAKYLVPNGVGHPTLFFFAQKALLARAHKAHKTAYGVNIISLTRTGGERELETVSAPFVRHSDTIEVLHPQISRTFEVTTVFFYTNGAGFLRTRLTF